MPFSPLATLQITDKWQVSPVTDGNFFRFKSSDNIGFSYLQVAQAQVDADGSIELFESRRFPILAGVVDLARLDRPPIINPANRRLAVRGLAPHSVKAPKLTLLIEDTTMIITNPSGSNTTTTVKTETKQELATMLEGAAANPNRNGGIILNQGKNKLFLGFGVNADKGSKLVILPGGQAAIESNFVGVINFMWDAIDPVANSASRAIVIEFVA
jgi:hypothetical protein